MLAPPPPKKPARMVHKTVLWGGVLAIIAVYLFATRPEPLGEGGTSQSNVPIESVFRMVASENDAVRKLWTADIVGAGTKAGLKFDEKWQEPSVAAGPLPALFLREAATALQKTRVPLGLFLGSDYPIAQSNLFTGEQAEYFSKVRETGNPAFFHAADIGRHTAMFPDIAVAPGCVSCHNEHPNSPKTDWKLNDIMGATTWSYPKNKVTTERLCKSCLHCGRALPRPMTDISQRFRRSKIRRISERNGPGKDITFRPEKSSFTSLSVEHPPKRWTI